MQLSGWPAELPELLVKRDQRVLTFDHRDAGVSTHFGSAGGVSMGGMIAQIVAADYPVRVLFLTSMMATSVKPGLPIIAKPERFA